MTKKEFKEYIKSFNKEKGSYTEDEIYKIGIAHKTLIKSEKNWKKLAEVLGIEKDGEYLRTFIKNKQKKDNILPKNAQILSERTIEDISFSDFDKKIIELQKQQVITRDWYNMYKKAIRDEARFDTFQDCLRIAIETLKELPTIEPFVYKDRVSNEAVLLVSDLHIGVECNNFYNKYNVDIARKRVDKLVKDTIEYCKLNKVQRLNVLNLGDLIQGIIHTSARLEQELDITQQIVVASEILSNALNELQSAAPEVIYRSVIDNHSRAIASLNESIAKENFGKLIDWYLRERLKKTKIIFACDNIDDGIGKFDLLNGKKIVFAHGHQDNASCAMQHFIGATKEFIDYVILGHYHTEKVKSFQGLKVIHNGSIVGVEQYALNKRLFDKPSQVLLIFNNTNLINVSIDLALIEEKR